MSSKKPSPFLKWVGGKRSILDELLKRLPKKFQNYYEPFVGGGALFFELSDRIEKAYLSDMNSELIHTYQTIQKNPELLTEKLRLHADQHSKEYFYRIREETPRGNIEKAARMIYLNRTCYNGLYRVNREGKFNAPMGSYKNPNIVQRENILACSLALQKAVIKKQDFCKITPKKGDFVYFDPPYYPLDATSFTSYTSGNFSGLDQIRLWEFTKMLDTKGVFWMISNSDTPLIRALFRDFSLQTIRAPRNVNCKAKNRGAVNELLICNFP